MKKKTVVLCVMLLVLPFVCLFAVSICFGYKGSVEIYVPIWNDEISWWSQIDALIQYGHPLGYVGYNETHAQIGTFGPWGIAPLLPYALFGKIFGWQLHSMAIANTCFLSLSLLLLIIMTRPTNRQIILIMIIYLSSYITIVYSFSSMAEGLRYSCAIILSGFLIWLSKGYRSGGCGNSRKTKVAIFLGIFFTLYCICVYLVFSLAVFPIVLLLLGRRKRINPLRNLLAAIVITAVVAVLSNKLVSMVSCPYCEESTLQILADQIKAEGLYQGACFALNNFFNNLRTVNYPELGGGLARAITEF